VRARLTFQPLCEVTVVAQTGSHPPLAGVCLVGLRVPPALPQADAARAALPPCAARAAQPSTLPLRPYTGGAGPHRSAPGAPPHHTGRHSAAGQLPAGLAVAELVYVLLMVVARR
jgi:hypothetical protein